MNFRLVWPRAIQTQLGDEYMRDRDNGLADEFTATVHRLEIHLAQDPVEASESRGGPDRIAIDWEVVMWFRLDEPNHAVVVTGIAYAG
jgi:hypothetical protein